VLLGVFRPEGVGAGGHLAHIVQGGQLLSHQLNVLVANLGAGGGRGQLGELIGDQEEGREASKAAARRNKDNCNNTQAAACSCTPGWVK
jgi:hypothetical protein